MDFLRKIKVFGSEHAESAIGISNSLQAYREAAANFEAKPLSCGVRGRGTSKAAHSLSPVACWMSWFRTQDTRHRTQDRRQDRRPDRGQDRGRDTAKDKGQDGRQDMGRDSGQID